MVYISSPRPKLHDRSETLLKAVLDEAKMRTTIALAVTIATVAACALQVSAQSFEENVTSAFRNSDRDDEEYLRFEWEGYDGWYNNPAHPDWGGAGNDTAALHGMS